MSTTVRPGRIAYYLLVLIGGVTAHQPWFGAGVGDLLRRNSEAFALMFLVPLFWDLFLPDSDPTDSADVRTMSPMKWPGAIAWFGVLLVAGIFLQTAGPTWLPQSITTLGEAFIGALVVTAYLAWSRSLFGNQGGIPAIASSAKRVLYYAFVLFVAVSAEQAFAETVLGGVAGWLRLQTEALAAMLLLALYFDAVATSRSRALHLVWYGALIAVPVLVQGGLLHGVLYEPLRFWLGTTTEAFLATLAVSVYFDLWRPHT